MKDHIIEFFDLENYNVNCKDVVDVDVKHKENLGITISPNPNQRLFSLFNSSPNRRSLSIKLYNALDQLIHQTDNLTIETSSSHYFTLNDIAQGIYTLSIQHADIFSNQPIVIVNN